MHVRGTAGRWIFAAPKYRAGKQRCTDNPSWCASLGAQGHLRAAGLGLTPVAAPRIGGAGLHQGEGEAREAHAGPPPARAASVLQGIALQPRNALGRAACSAPQRRCCADSPGWTALGCLQPLPPQRTSFFFKCRCASHGPKNVVARQWGIQGGGHCCCTPPLQQAAAPTPRVAQLPSLGSARPVVCAELASSLPLQSMVGRV